MTEEDWINVCVHPFVCVILKKLLMPYQTIKDFLCKIKQMLGSTSACKIFNCSISSEIVKKEQMIKCLSFSVEKVGGISENLSHKATVF